MQKTKIMASRPITSWQIDGETMETVTGFIFLGSEITADGDCSHEIKTHLLLVSKVMTNLDSILKSFVNKAPSSQGYGFSSGDVWMWELDYKESWAAKNWCFWTVVLEKTLESPLDCKKIQPVHPKGLSSLRLTQTQSIESVMPSSHLILCRPLLLLPPIPPSIRVFSNESTLRMRWPVLEFQL